jgi:hypothetical protein
VSCDQVRPLMAELALGIADGEERAQALRHLAGCTECRRALEELSEVTDELLLLVPEHEPPPGFESRVLARVAPSPSPSASAAPRRRLRPRRALVGALAAAAVAAVAATAITLNATSDDRRLAGHYRQTLAQAHGSSFEAARLLTPSGARAGVVFGYRGSPSWIFVDVEPPYRSGAYTAELTLTSGRRVPLPSVRVDPATGSTGRAIPVDLRQVAAVRLVGRGPGGILSAELPHAGWGG